MEELTDEEAVVREDGDAWTIVHQAPLSMGFSQQEYWSGLPFPSPGDLPNPGIEPGSLALQADSTQAGRTGTTLACER